MWEMGLSSTRIIHRFLKVRPLSENRLAPRVEFVLEDGTVYTIPRRSSPLDIDSAHLPGILMGRYWRTDDGTLFEQPGSMAHKNSISLVDLQNALVKTLRPDIPLAGRPLRISEEHRKFLRRVMSSTENRP